MAEVLRLKLNELAGVTAFDSSGLAHNFGNVNMIGNEWNPAGKWDGSLDYDGINQHSFMTILSADFSFAVGTFTISLWVKTLGNNMGLIHLRTNNLPGSASQVWVYVIATGEIRFGTYAGAASFIDGNVPVDNGAWRHVACVRSGALMSIYVDGDFDNSGSPVIRNITTQAVWLSTYYGAVLSAFLAGALDEVRIFNTALSPTEISNLKNYNSLVAPPTPPTPSGIVLPQFNSMFNRPFNQEFN